MSQTAFKSRIVPVSGLIVAVLLIAAQVWASSPGAPPARAVPVEGQPAGTSPYLEAAFAGNVFVGAVTVSGKDGRPWMGVRGEARLLDSSGRQLAVVPLQPLGPGEFRLIAPLGRLDGSGYLEVRLPGREQAGEQRGLYRIDRDRRAVTWVQATPGAAAPLSVQGTGGPDEFGYTWDSDATYSWIDTSGGTSVTLRDDDWAGPFEIGFTFNFYEQSHTQFYLDSNGYIGFDSTQTASYYANTRLPYSGRPDSLVAPFWDDFDPSQGGTVRYQTFGSAPDRYLVVEWNGVPLWGTSDAQSFQLILYESSNHIKFQYPTARSGEGGDLRYATTGIENADGTIGLEYLYLIPTDVTRAVQFNYGRSTYNVFMTPGQQGAPAAAGESASLYLTVKNLGTSSDSFTMSRPAYSGSNWSVSFPALSGYNTGVIEAGQEKTIMVQVQVPGDAVVGDWTRATVRATSDGNTSEYHEVALDVMVGTSFAQAYTDNESGDGTEDSENYFDALQDGQRHTERVTTDQDNSSYAGVATTPDGNAVNVWNTTYYNGAAWVSEIQYALLSLSGGLVHPVTRVTNNSGATHNTYDFSPAVDVAPNGNTAFGWAQQVDADGDGYLDRFNTRYTIVNSSGSTVQAPTALTENESNYPRDYPPSVAALANGRFLLAWEHATSSSGPVDIYCAVLNNDGSVYKPATHLTDGTGWNVTPRVAPLQNWQAAIVWTSYNDSGYPEIVYAAVNSSCGVVGGPAAVTSNGDSGAGSYYADAVALSDDRLGIAWTQLSDSEYHIQYTIVSSSAPTPTPSTPTATSTSTSTPTPTPTPTSPPSDWVTITSEDFEGSFPGEWLVIDNDGTSFGEYYWGKRNCQAYAGSYSGWAVGDGADGAALSCGSNYPDNADSWMVYGPFSLADATAGDLSFKLWLNSESNIDKLCRYASLDGSSFSGTCTTGNSSGWIDRVLDLTDVYSLGNLMGQANVWIALRFYTDMSINYQEGAHVDDIVLRKCTSSTCTGVSSAALASDNGQIVEVPAQEVLAPRPAPIAVDIQPAAAPEDIYTVPNDLCEANIYVSLTTDEDDHLIMTWLDNYGAQYLFYALADQNGAIDTPATIFQRTRHSYLWSSWNGYGNDTLAPAASAPEPQTLYLPLVIKDYASSEPKPTATPVTPTATPGPMTNGDFENGDFSGWTSGSDTSNPGRPAPEPEVVTSVPHSGSYAVVLGEEDDACESVIGESGYTLRSWIYQDIWVPTSGSPQLTFYYRILTYDKLNEDKYDRFEAYINGTLLGRYGNTSSNYKCSNPINDLGWQAFTYDLSAYRGQTIRLQLVNVTHPDRSYSTWTYVDDVAVTQ